MSENRTVKLNNGIEVDRIGIGFWESRGQEAADAVRYAVEAGYRRIDTAEFYKNEREVGEGIKNCGIDRKELFVASKIWFTDMCEGRQEEMFYATLERLGLDYLDLYYLHWPIGEVTRSWRVLERLYEAGKVRSIGVCNFQKVHLEQLLAKANVCPAVNQIESNPRFQQSSIIELCHKEEIVPEAWGPLGKGRDIFLPLFAELAQKYGKTPAQIILRWHLQRGMNIIPKSIHEERIRENINVYDFELEEKDMAAIRALDTGVSGRKAPEPYHYDRICENTTFEE